MKEQEEKRKIWRRYVDGLYSRKDVKKLSEQLREPGISNLLTELMDEVWEETSISQPDDPARREEYKKEARRLLKRIKPRQQMAWRRFIRVAASLAAVVCLAWGGWEVWNTYSRSTINYVEISTSYGEQRDIRLPDGSQLVLNACSHLRYPEQFDGDERLVTLEGEAYFHVYPDADQPFLVETPHFNVRVLGTCFDVKSYTSDRLASVDVENGKVQVDLPDAMMRLTADERVLINTVSGEYAKQREEADVAVWRRGCLRFNRTPLADVARELERRYNCRIVFADTAGYDNLITGQHDNQTLEAVLRSIKITSGIHYRAEGDTIVFYK